MGVADGESMHEEGEWKKLTGGQVIDFERVREGGKREGHMELGR